MAEFNVMVKHMHAHVDVPGRGFVRRMKSHGDGALIVHVNVGGARITKTKVLEEHAQVKSFFGGFGTSNIFAFLRAEKCSAVELDLPRACSTVKEEDVSTSALVAIGICAPIRVREAVKHKAMCIVGTVDDAEVFRFDEIASNTYIGVEVLLRGVVNIAPQN